MQKDNRQAPKQAVGRQGRTLISFAIAILAVLGFIFGGWGTVYAAQDSQPEDFLYPVKVAVDYLTDLTTIASVQDVATGPKNATSIQIQKTDQDRTRIEVVPKEYQWQKGAPWKEEVVAEPLLGDLDLPIDDTLTTTPTITATRTMSGSLWGPGPCFGGPENCELELTAPYGYTYTHGMDDEAPFKGTPPITDPAPSLGPGEPPVKEVQEPAGNNPVGNNGASDTDGQKKGGKP